MIHMTTGQLAERLAIAQVEGIADGYRDARDDMQRRISECERAEDVDRDMLQELRAWASAFEKQTTYHRCKSVDMLASYTKDYPGAP